jgi:hypothetical protein
MIDVRRIMTTLALRRPIFHSEADFQHEFAITLRELMPESLVRLEQPFGYGKGGATDIVARVGGATFGIELKYLTRKFVWETADEKFHLKAQGATDLRRYDVLKDAERLELFNQSHSGKSYVIALTNDPAYWRPTSRPSLIDADFRLCEGRAVSGELKWAAHASVGTTKGRNAAINLMNEYRIRWNDYVMLGEGAATFRYLALEIG